MDLSGVCECPDGMKMYKKLESSRSNEIHANYGRNVWTDLESGVNDYNLQMQKTEINIPHEKIGSHFVSGALPRINTQFSGSKKAMDLSCRVNRNESPKTIFEDADYFSRNYLYKLMPITFEAVNETIIHIEHNYCNFDSSPDEYTNKAIHGDAEERNYKKRKSKSSCGEGFLGPGPDNERDEKESGATCGTFREGFVANAKFDEDYSMPIQPLDLSLPCFYEQRNDKMLKEKQSNIPKTKSESRGTSDVKQFDMCESNKENVTASARKIEVTISRPGQKEYYQPCEMFLNDVARISPDLIKNDCYEIDIIDRTGEELYREKCRTYYIVSESTWQTFENSTERIILTNDLNIGEPMQNNEKLDKPTYLIFDQYSLTESLAKICEKKGGSFEYTCLEESMPKAQDARREVQDCGSEFAVSRVSSEEGSWKGREESYADASKRHLTETDILKRLLLCENRNGDIEPDSIRIPTEVTSNKPEERRLETEEKVCDNSRSASTGTGAAEEGEQAPMQTEPQVPIEINRKHVIPEAEAKNQTVGLKKTEAAPEQSGESKYSHDDEDGAGGRGRKEQREKAIDESESKSVLKIGKRSKRNKESLALDAGDVEPNKKKIKSKDGKEEKKIVDANSSRKRVTRSRASLTEEEPQSANPGIKRGKKIQTKAKAESSGNGEGKEFATTETEKKRKTKKIAEALPSAGGNGGADKIRKRNRKESYSAKTVNDLGRKRKEEDRKERRETRSAAKIKAVENRRRTRRMNEESAKAKTSSASLKKSCAKRLG